VRIARLAVDYAFRRLQLTYLHAHYLALSNPASARVLRDACGFEPDRTRGDVPVADRFAVGCPGDHWTFVRLERAAGVDPWIEQ
jgi:RimJ/RimL family protein N-acetyltransferase